MKIVTKNLNLFLRLGITASALLLGQQALALGTDAGTPVSNQATVAYTVGTTPQTPIESDPNGNSTPGAGNPTVFLVDRRVDFTLVEVGNVHTTPVAPGENDVITAFTLTNNGNAIMDFRMSVVDYALDVHGLPDGTDLVNYRVRVANGDGAGGVPDLATDLDYVDELAEDAVVEIYVFADAPITVSNGQHANIELRATAADEADAVATPGTLDPDLGDDSGNAFDPDVIQNVFADAGADGFEVVQDGYSIVSANLVITKEATVFSAPFGSDKALPGAVIEYVIEIDNSAGSAPATGIVITDALQIADVEFQNGVYNGGASNISFTGPAYCNADDATDTDGDGCSYDIATGDLVIAVPDVAGGAITEVRFQVLIPNT